MSAQTLGRPLSALAILAGLAACSASASGGATANVGYVPQTAAAQPSGRGNPVQVFTANRGYSSILGFKAVTRNTTGNVAPTTTIAGSNTLLSDPSSLAMDAQHNTYVANAAGNQIEVFAAGANGNVAPVRIISGPATQLFGINGLYVDPNGYLWAANYSAGTVTAYAPGANGNVAPAYEISGVSSPAGMVMNQQGELFVAEPITTGIFVFAKNSDGHFVQVGQIAGDYTDLANPQALAFDSNGRLLVGDFTAGVVIFAAGATGNVAPVQWITGISGDGVLADSSNRIWVTDSVNNAIDEFASNASGGATPLRTIHGHRTTLSNPTGLVMN